MLDAGQGDGFRHGVRQNDALLWKKCLGGGPPWRSSDRSADDRGVGEAWGCREMSHYGPKAWPLGALTWGEIPMRASFRLIAAAVFLTVASSAFTQTCEITGNVPASLSGVICSVTTSVHGGDAPVNQLTIIVTREMAFALRAKTPDADNVMLALLDRWMTDRGVRVARVEAFYGRAHLATAKTRVFGAPRVEYH